MGLDMIVLLQRNYHFNWNKDIQHKRSGYDQRVPQINLNEVSRVSQIQMKTNPKHKLMQKKEKSNQKCQVQTASKNEQNRLFHR